MSLNKELTEKQKNDKIELTDKQLQAIERTLNKGDRVEIIPIKDGCKVFKVRREKI